MRAADRLIVALDVPTVFEAQSLIDVLADAVGVYKIGLELLFAGGGELARELAGAGKPVFVDAKLLDIETTVERAVANIAELGAAFATVHATDGKTLDAAVRGRGDSPLKLLGVTLLTNLDESDLAAQGIAWPLARLVLHRAENARDAGFDGVIASGQEAMRLRKTLGPDRLIVTPGIRPGDAGAEDQARVTTPADAILNGADYIVVGRPITRAPDPQAAAIQIAEEMEQALARIG